MQTEKKGLFHGRVVGVSKWSGDNGDQPERLSVTVQKAAKASYMSECGQGLNREVKRKSKCYIVVLYKIHV